MYCHRISSYSIPWRQWRDAITQREQDMQFLGEISYLLYMVHYPLVYFYVAWISNNKGISMRQAWPYASLILIGGIVVAYAALKCYDEPVRKWLRKKLA